MKKMILSLMSVTLGCAAFAANCVSVKQISTNYVSHQITIALTRNGCTGDNTNHRNTAWVFVDYRTVTGTTKGAWSRATISAVSAGTVVNSGNSKGAWINGANGTQTVTLTLSGMPAKYDWCAFATDYPPNIGAVNGGAYTLRGTQSFVVNGNPVAGNQTSSAVSSLTDATGCPGCMAVRDFKFSGSNVGIPCCSNLTAVNGYCRDLAADDAAKMTCNGVEHEVKLTDVVTTWNPNSGCDAANGWVYPSPAQLRCMWNEKDRLKVVGFKYFSNSTGDYDDVCNDGSHMVTLLITATCPSCCAPRHTVPAGTLLKSWYYQAPRDEWMPAHVKCIR